HVCLRAVRLALLSVLCLILPVTIRPAQAAPVEIAILKSSNIAAYEQAIEGFKATAPSNSVYAEYDAQADLDVGNKLAKKIRSANPDMVVAVGLKAALAAKSEITDVPVVFMMVLDPQKHNLTASNVTGTLLEIPIDRQVKLIRSFLPEKHHMGLLFDPKKS